MVVLGTAADAGESAASPPRGVALDLASRGATLMLVTAPADSLLLTGRHPARPRRRLWLAPETPDPWRGTDKKLHAVASYAACLTYRLADDNAPRAAAASMALGILKEAHDVWIRPPGRDQGASWRDLVADAAGVAAGLLVWSALAP